MRTRIITTENELVRLRDSWDRLVCENPETDMPFFRWDWFYRNWIHFGKPENRELAVTVFEYEEKTVGILPLVTGVRKIRPHSMGAQQELPLHFSNPQDGRSAPDPAGAFHEKKTLSQRLATYRVLEFCNADMMPRNTLYFMPILGAANVAKAICERLFIEQKRWDMLNLVNIPETSAFHDFWLHPPDGVSKHSVIRNRGLRAPFLTLGGSLDDYLQSLDKKTRYNIKRYVKMFESSAEENEVRIFSRPEEADEALELSLAVRKKSWKGDYRNPRYPMFYRDIFPLLFERGEAVVIVVLRNKTPIGAAFRLRDNGIYYGFGTDFDVDFKAAAPGTLLFYYLLQHMSLRGETKFDFCGDAYEYKLHYASGTAQHSNFEIFHPGLKSRLLFYAKTSWLPLLRQFLCKPVPEDFISFENRFRARSVSK